MENLKDKLHMIENILGDIKEEKLKIEKEEKVSKEKEWRERGEEKYKKEKEKAEKFQKTENVISCRK